MPWGHLHLDRVWVSLDGPEETNDLLRGKGVFGKVMDNIDSSGHGNVFVSTTVSTENILQVPDLIAQLRGKVAGITIQFYYPYQGLPDPLFVGRDARTTFLDRLIEMKKAGHPVANTMSSLQQLKNVGWYCEDRLLANAEPDGTISHGCYLKNRGPTQCELCGFSAHNEMTLAFRGKPASIRAGLYTFFG
jgi:MoaA/NifB/PqqE/SkfB family radical SAM enzyme